MNSLIHTLADRHMRADPTGVLADAAETRGGVVRVVVDPDFAPTYSGQHSAWLLVNLLARQFRVVEAIHIDAPDVPLLEGVAAFGTASTLRAALTACVGLVGGDLLKVANHGPADVTLVVGTTGPDLSSEHTWYLRGDGWRWYVGTTPFALATAPARRTAIGPYLAASFAAGEAFKVLRGVKPGRGAHIESLYGSAWTMTTAAGWQALADGPELDHCELPHVYFAGAGAVAQASMLTLGASGVQGRATAIDDDELDLTNNNRYLLATQSDEGGSKVGVAERYFRSTRIECKPAPVRWAAFVAQPGHSWSYPDLAEERRAYRFPIVMSCVDKNGARHEVQNARPELIISGSTHGLAARAQIFDPARTAGCLKCFNPPEQTVQVAKATIERARLVSDEERDALCAQLGVSGDELQRVLNASGCGSLTPSDIERFGTGPAEMSVGFVSAAAGVLQAAQLIRAVHPSNARTAFAEPASFAAFGQGRFRSSAIARDATCSCALSRRGKTQDVVSLQP